MLKKVLIVALLGFTMSAQAYLIDDKVLKGLAGYTLSHVGKITGYKDKAHPSDKAQSKEFEGCAYDRELFVDEKYVVACREETLGMAMNPDIFIFDKGEDRKALIDGQLYYVR